MAEISDDKANIISALLAQLVAANVDGDAAIALTNAGMKQADVARLLGIKPNAVGMRIARAASAKGTKDDKKN